MDLTPSDAEKLLLAVAGMVARDRRERGVKLNRPEAVALLSTWVIERAREGATVAELMRTGTEVLGPDDVMPGVADLVDEVQVEATFPDGRKLVTLHHPIGHRDDDSHAASGSDPAGPGAVRVGAGEIELNADRGPEDRLELVVENTGDRPIQIGSHLHLPDANPALHFDRQAAYGFRLDVPSGTSARFEPGAGQVVHAVRLRGAARVPGLQIGKEAADGLDRA